MYHIIEASFQYPPKEESPAVRDVGAPHTRMWCTTRAHVRRRAPPRRTRPLSAVIESQQTRYADTAKITNRPRYLSYIHIRATCRILYSAVHIREYVHSAPIALAT